MSRSVPMKDFLEKGVLRNPMRRIVVGGHQRSGTHYLRALVSTNFLDGEWGQDVPYTFNFGNDLKWGPNGRFLYLVRSFTNVSRSVYDMKYSFGLVVESYEQFLATKYKNMFSPNIAMTVRVNRVLGDTPFYNTSVRETFKGINMTPKEYWEAHIESWVKLYHEYNNILFVSYSSLLSDLNNQIDRIAQFFEIEREEEVKDIPVTIGIMSFSREVTDVNRSDEGMIELEEAQQLSGTEPKILPGG